jgi:phosphatidylserine decarboxylase
MPYYDKETVDAKYQRLFGRFAGYLPADRKAVDDFQKNLAEKVGAKKAASGPLTYAGSVKDLQELIKSNGIVRMYVTEMIDQQPLDQKKVTSIDDLLDQLNEIISIPPQWNVDPKVRNMFPMSSLFTYMMMTPAGEAIFRNDAFNTAIANILKEWCWYLDSPESRYVLTTDPENGWLSPSAYWVNKLYEFEIPDQSAEYWGFKSFNAYFHRGIKPECRPIAEPDNPKIVVSSNDGTVYNIQDNVQREDQFWVKGQNYSLENMLNGLYVEKFAGGMVFQSFLSGADYHRWVSPVAGQIVKIELVEALMFSDAESAGFDNTAATYSQGYEASVNTRGLVFVESPEKNIGLVCVMPIGITEISSVRFSVSEGDYVTKGQELGYFSYGGSSMCLVFQPGAIDQFTVPNRVANSDPDDGPPIRVNAQIAIAR